MSIHYQNEFAEVIKSTCLKKITLTVKQNKCCFDHSLLCHHGWVNAIQGENYMAGVFTMNKSDIIQFISLQLSTRELRKSHHLLLLPVTHKQAQRIFLTQLGIKQGYVKELLLRLSLGLDHTSSRTVWFPKMGGGWKDGLYPGCRNSDSGCFWMQISWGGQVESLWQGLLLASSASFPVPLFTHSPNWWESWGLKLGSRKGNSGRGQNRWQRSIKYNLDKKPRDCCRWSTFGEYYIVRCYINSKL